MDLSWDKGRKICSNDPDHMTKMAAMLMFGKNHILIQLSDVVETR